MAWSTSQRRSTAPWGLRRSLPPPAREPGPRRCALTDLSEPGPKTAASALRAIRSAFPARPLPPSRPAAPGSWNAGACGSSVASRTGGDLLNRPSSQVVSCQDGIEGERPGSCAEEECTDDELRPLGAHLMQHGP